mgnify:FL=1
MSNTIINNAGKYNRQITIYQETITKDTDGFPVKTKTVILQPYASVKTTRGFTLIQNDSSFEKAFTNFTIRYPITQITRDMLIEFNGKIYTIQYLNNVNEANVELEIQAKEVTH